MREAQRKRFEWLIRTGVTSKDIHDVPHEDGFEVGRGAINDVYVARELELVGVHQRALTPLLERFVTRAPRVLDFGCGTGATTVAIALSRLACEKVVGVDANPAVIELARVRAEGHGLEPKQVRFQFVPHDEALPFADASFDLVLAVSVLEFITRPSDRDAVVRELRRVVAPGGFLYIATPRFGLREHHTRTWLGDALRRPGEAWSSTPWQQRSWGRGWQAVDIRPELKARFAQRYPYLPRVAVDAVSPALGLLGDWNKLLFRRPVTETGETDS